MDPFFSKNEEKIPKLQVVDKVHDDVVYISSIHGHVPSLKTRTTKPNGAIGVG
jgi:hypothetical protein